MPKIRDNSVYKFDMYKILVYGMKVEGKTTEHQLYLSLENTMKCFADNKHKAVTKDKDSSFLFDQISKEEITANDFLYNVLCIMDFSNCEEKQYEKLADLYDGIYLTIPNSDMEKEILFVDFLKSNSMSREASMYYVNKQYYDILRERLTFTTVHTHDKIIISKWYAYSALVLSSCQVLNDINLDKDEVVIIPDREYPVRVRMAVTAINDAMIIKSFNAIIRDRLDGFKDRTLRIDEAFEKRYRDTYGNSYREDMYKNDKDYRAIENFLNNCKSYAHSPDFPYIPDVNLIGITKLVASIYMDSRLDFVDGINTQIIKTSKEYQSISENGVRIKEQRSKWYKLQVKDYRHTTNMFDGEGLIDEELAMQINYCLEKIKNDKKEEKYKKEISLDDIREHFSNKKYAKSFQIRFPFIKGMVHAANLKQFFKDREVSYIYGLTYEEGEERYRKYDVSKVKMILTESQFKLKTFIELFKEKKLHTLSVKETIIDAYFRYLSMYDYHLGVKPESNKNTSGNKVRLNYQFWSTVPLIGESMDEVIQSSKDEISRRLTRSEILKDYAHDDAYQKDFEIYKADYDFYEATSKYRNEIMKKHNDMYADFALGRLFVNGYRKYLCGDLLALLYRACYHQVDDKEAKNMPEKFDIPVNMFYMPNTPTDVPNTSGICVLARNPHYSRSELAMLTRLPELNEIDEKNRLYDVVNERNKYFKYLQKVVFFNPVGLTSERLGGADYDGDEAIIVNERSVVEKSYKHLTALYKTNKEKRIVPSYPPVLIPSEVASIKENLFMYRVTYFKNTFINEVGLISNLAFYNTFESYHDNEMPYETIQVKKENPLNEDDKYELKFLQGEDPIARYTIYGGLEIDAAKTGSHPYLMGNNQFKNNLGKSLKAFQKALNRFNKARADREKDAYKNYEKSKNAADIALKKLSLFSDRPIFKFLNDYHRLEKFTVPKKEYEFMHFNDFTASGMISALQAIVIYNDVEARLKKENATDEKTERIIEKIKEIVDEKTEEENSIDVFDFIDSFRTDHNKENYQNYFKNATPFHYMRTKEEKLDYLASLFDINDIKKEYLDIICDFEDEGYLTLYLILRLLDYQEHIAEKNASDNKPKDFDFYNINSRKITRVLEDSGMSLKSIQNQVSVLEDIVYDEVKELETIKSRNETYYEKIKGFSLLNGVTFEDLLNIYGESRILNDNLIFILFAEQTEKYLRKVKAIRKAGN